MNQFLEDHQFMYDRVKANIDVHPSDDEVAMFQELARKIDPHKSFQSSGCVSCVNNLVRFVYDKQKTLEVKEAEATQFIKKETFPKHEGAKEDRETKGD